MPLEKFVNTTELLCTPPLLDQSLFDSTGGYQPGRYCGLGSSGGGTTCCLPCPVQDWLYPPEWKEQFRVPKYLSILSVILCSFLLLSFAVLPPAQTHRHYLNVGLLFPALFISFSFVIPVAVDPPLCYDAITPNDMHSSMSCAWTGALVTLGELGCAVWVFLRCLWFHIRIFWDKDPGEKFKWGSILAGTLIPLISLIAMLAATGLSYRMGQTCLPNHDNAIVTFWAWLISFASAGFLLQTVTTGYCVWVYTRSLRHERRRSVRDSFQRGQTTAKIRTWKTVKNLFLLQWRNILVCVFTIIGSVAFFIVFWTQDNKLGRVFDNPDNSIPLKTWILCQTLSGDDKEECKKYVKNFTVPQESVLVSLVLASLVGIEIFILLFRFSMLLAWRDYFLRLFNRAPIGCPSTPQLTSLESSNQFIPPSPSKRQQFVSSVSAETPAPTSSKSSTSDYYTHTSETDNIMPTPVPHHRSSYEPITAETELLPQNRGEHLQSCFETASSIENSWVATPGQYLLQGEASIPARTQYPIQRETTTRNAHIPQWSALPPSTLSVASRHSLPVSPTRQRSMNSLPLTLTTARSRWSSVLSIQRTNSSKPRRPRISAPVEGTLVHVNGVDVSANRPDIDMTRVSGMLGMNLAGLVEGRWENEEEEEEEEEEEGREGVENSREGDSRMG